MSDPTTNAPKFNSARDARAQAKAAKAYRKANRPLWKKKRLYVLGFILLLIIIAALSGGGDKTSSTPAAGTSPSSSDASPSSSPSPSSSAFTAAFLGQTRQDILAQPGVPATRDSVSITATALTPGEQFGDPIVCTSVSMQNGKDEQISFGSYDFKLQDTGGAIRTPTFTGDNDLASGDVAPGGQVSGNVCFDGANTGQVVVFYDPTLSMSSNARIAWINNL